MHHVNLPSSNIKSCGYDPAKKELHVTFSGGATYKYHDVPTDIHQELIRSKSPGSYLHHNIKKAKYKFTKL